MSVHDAKSPFFTTLGADGQNNKTKANFRRTRSPKEKWLLMWPPPIPHSHAVKHGRTFPHMFMQAFPCTWHGWIHVCTCTYMHTHIHPHPFTQTPWVPRMFFTRVRSLSMFSSHIWVWYIQIAFLFFRVYTRQDIPGPMLFKQVSVEIR